MLFRCGIKPQCCFSRLDYNYHIKLEGGGKIGRKLKAGSVICWKKTVQNYSKRNERKERIRQAFSNDAHVEVIPAIVSEQIDNRVTLRVAAYCRVSTYEETQAGSFELQVQHYKEVIEENPKWKLAGIYSDEGVSATSMSRRVGFLKMLDDCEAGKIDLITKTSHIKNGSRTLKTQ